MCTVERWVSGAEASVLLEGPDLTRQNCCGKTLNASDLSVLLLSILFSAFLGTPEQRWWSVGPAGLERRGDGRKGGAGSPALTWSSQDHFASKKNSWYYTKKHKNKAKLILEENSFFPQKCVLPVRNTWEYKVHLVFTVVFTDHVSSHLWTWTLNPMTLANS